MTAKEAICKNCGHGRNGHVDKWGGICVGCPCPGFESVNAAESLPAQPEFKCGTCGEPVSIYQNIWLHEVEKASQNHNVVPVPVKSLPVEANSLFPPLGDRSLHFEDAAIIAAMEGTDYLVNGVRQRLSHMTTGEKWSLYRAVVKLSKAEPKPTPSTPALESPKSLAEKINSLWTGKEMLPCGCPASSEYIYYNSETGLAHCVKCGDAYKHESQLKPQPDSSSITEPETDFVRDMRSYSAGDGDKHFGITRAEAKWIVENLKTPRDSSSIGSEQTFEEAWDAQAGTVYSEPKYMAKAFWNAAKGQSNGR